MQKKFIHSIEEQKEDIRSLYQPNEKSANSIIAKTYSKMKLGDIKEILKFAKKISKLIQYDLKKMEPLKKSQIVVTHVPTIIRESGIHYIAEMIAKLLKLNSLELMRKRHSFNYQLMPKKLRFNKTKNLIYCKGKVKNKYVFLIDDSSVTGSMMQASEYCLRKKGAREVFKYVILNIQTKKPEIESIFDMALYYQLGLKNVVYLLNKNEKTPTNFRITLLYHLSPRELEQVIKKLSKSNRKWIGEKVRGFPSTTPVGKSVLRNL